MVDIDGQLVDRSDSVAATRLADHNDSKPEPVKHIYFTPEYVYASRQPRIIMNILSTQELYNGGTNSTGTDSLPN